MNQTSNPPVTYRIEPKGRAPRWRIGLLVTVLFVLLAFVLCPCKIRGRGDRARATAAEQDIHQFIMALTAFKADTGRLPNTQDGLTALCQQPEGLANWKGPYVLSQAGFKDPWGNPYVYRRKFVRGADDFQVLSAGPDGKEGTADDISGSNPSTP